jgi:hypothetical protein
MSGLRKLLRWPIVLGILLIFAGATSSFAASFSSDWKAATKVSPPADSFLGAWEGQWKSRAHHVSGPLRCVIKDLGNGQYEAHFHAQFHWFHFSYSTKLVAEKSEKGMTLKGQANLGWMGGLYRYLGEASPSKYFSTYNSPVENGVLELARPKST